MGGLLKTGGYTIVEVMIFLAVSGLMFVVAATMVSGKQDQAGFKQSMNDIRSEVRQVINQVGNGYYPTQNNFTCLPSTPNLTLSTSANPEGTNQGCVFLGQAIQFDYNGDETKYNVYSIAGSQYANGATSGDPPTSFSEAIPTVIDNTGHCSSNCVNLTQLKTLQWGAQATAMYDYASSGNIKSISAIAFTSSFSQLNGSGGLVSGSQDINTVAIDSSPALGGTGASYGESQMVGDINSDLQGAPGNNDLRSTPYVVVCFKGGQANYGTLTIGGDNSQRLSTSMKISSSDITITFPDGTTRACPA